jgi:hypothetical protein
MTTTPYDRTSLSIPVTVVTNAAALKFVEPGARILHLEPALHDHPAGSECVACAARGDVRALLFDLLQKARSEQRPLTAVVVDASDLKDSKPIIARLETGAVPAFGLRDHTVLRSFHLSRVL